MKAISPGAREDSVSTALYAAAGALLIVGLLAAFAWLPRLIRGRESDVGRAAPAFRTRVVANAEPLVELNVAPGAPSLPPATISLADLKGHAVLLDFWATWCGPCKAEAPIVDRVATRFKSRGLVVIGVNTDDGDLASSWAHDHHLGYPIAFDADNSASRAYGVEVLPTLVVISKEGKIIAQRTGVTPSDELERLVNEAL
jgi:thiol-disulfide isomerase/thioredoxin